MKPRFLPGAFVVKVMDPNAGKIVEDKGHAPPKTADWCHQAARYP